jgi:hypothetical protein
LLPLVPYLLKALPVISASRLQLMYRDLERGISSIVQTKSCDTETDSGRQQQAAISARAVDVLQLLKRFSSINIDMSVLTVTDMPMKMKALCKRQGLSRQPEVLTALKNIRDIWKNSCKHSHRDSTIQNLRGGNVITVGRLGKEEDLQTPPAAVPSALWKVLARTHNETQLFAIKYVVSSMKIDEQENENDTRICLIQGPPGK